MPEWLEWFIAGAASTCLVIQTISYRAEDRRDRYRPPGRGLGIVAGVPPPVGHPHAGPPPEYAD